MGTTISGSMLSAEIFKKSTAPIILCSFTSRMARLVEDGQYVPLNLNIELAGALLRYPPSERGQKANDEVMRIAGQCQKPTLLEYYEILFDPRYRIDAIKVLIEISRRQKVVIKWCGSLTGNVLEYATPEHRDYHSFNIQNYDIICVI